MIRSKEVIFDHEIPRGALLIDVLRTKLTEHCSLMMASKIVTRLADFGYVAAAQEIITHEAHKSKKRPVEKKYLSLAIIREILELHSFQENVHAFYDQHQFEILQGVLREFIGEKPPTSPEE